MPEIGRDGFLASSGPLRGRPNRLSWEARRNARYVETGLAVTVVLVALRVQLFIDQPSLTHGIYAASSTLSVFLALWARRRLYARAVWLETTDRWWERLDEMPHILMLPRLQHRLDDLSVRSLLARVRRGRPRRGSRQGVVAVPSRVHRSHRSQQASTQG